VCVCVYVNVINTSQRTQNDPINNASRQLLCREVITLYCENHTEHINTLRVQNGDFLALELLVHILNTRF